MVLYIVYCVDRDAKLAPRVYLLIERQKRFINQRIEKNVKHRV